MRRLIRLVARLYPGEWRRRYGVEFDALLEDAPADLRELLNVFGGALKMNVSSGTGLLKLVAATALAGLAIAAIVSLLTPRTYVATATLRIVGAHEWSLGWLPQAEQDELSRAKLSELVRRPSLDLYESERKHDPELNGILRRMRNQDISIRLNEKGDVVTISFQYPDREKAQLVVKELARGFAESRAAFARNEVRHSLLIFGEAPPQPVRLEMVQQASVPERPLGPNRLQYAAVGLGIGLAVGVLAALLLRRPRWTLQVAAFAAVGCAIALAIAWWTPRTYRSQAVMRIMAPLAPAHVLTTLQYPNAAQLLAQLENKVLSGDSQAIHIVPLPQTGVGRRGQDLAFLITVDDSNPLKAQAVARALVMRFLDSNVATMRDRFNVDRKLAMNVLVLDPATLPDSPIGPTSTAISLWGLMAGSALGAIWTAARRKPRHAGGAA